MAIAQAPAPALACIVGNIGKGGDSEDVLILIAIVVNMVVKINNNLLNFLALVLPCSMQRV
jgi:hypothetical protein